jgi:hypothetical protein
MAKAIHWPLQFRDEVLAEDCETVFCAFRLGRLYFDNQFWVDGEIVDIRVNHLKVRKAVVVGELVLCKLSELTTEMLAAQKTPLQTLEASIQFLASNYNQSVTEETLITVVFYKNLPVIQEEIEA